MQPHFGANPCRKRGFAGDFAAESGLVGRIARSGRVPGMVTAKETADSQKPPLPGRRSKIPPHVS